MRNSPQSWRMFAAGVAVALLLAGPIIGAVQGTLTIERNASGGNTPRAVAHRILEGVSIRHYEAADIPSLSIEPASDCEDAQHQKESRLSGVQFFTFADLYSAVWVRHRRIANFIRDGSAENGLSDLPTPLLGALEGCIYASLMARLCERYVARITSAPLTSVSRKLLQDNDKSAERVWCLLASYPPPTQHRDNPTPRHEKTLK